MGPLQAEFVMAPGDALFVKSYTPHKVQTADDYSMHMAFDICDRRVNAETALHLLLEQYQRESVPTYTPTGGILEKLVSHSASPRYQEHLAQLGQAQAENYQRARAMLGANRVGALDKLIATEAKRRG